MGNIPIISRSSSQERYLILAFSFAERKVAALVVVLAFGFPAASFLETRMDGTRTPACWMLTRDMQRAMVVRVDRCDMVSVML